MGECIRCEQKAEIIRDGGKWLWKDRKDCQAQQYRKTYQENRAALALSDTCAGAFNPCKPVREEAGKAKRQYNCQSRKSGFEFEQRHSMLRKEQRHCTGLFLIC